MLVKKDGSLWIVGQGSYGKLGAGNTNHQRTLTENTLAEVGHDNARVFAGKNYFSMILKTDGRLLAAGQNDYGQLGNGTNGDQSKFTAVLEKDENKPISDVAFVSLGDSHSMILKKDGTLWAVGRNSDFQLGLSSSTAQTKAIMVLDKVAHVAAGYNHTLAVKEDGTLWAAGSNSYGQFGRGNQTGNDGGLWTQIDISKL
jgi:alpha-tubulin suppressor-like RCC1 family protein